MTNPDKVPAAPTKDAAPQTAQQTAQQRADACLASVQAALSAHGCDIVAVIEDVLPVGRGAATRTVQVSAGWRIVATP